MKQRARLALPLLLAGMALTPAPGHAAPAPPPTASVRLANGTIFFSDASAGSAQRLSIRAITQSARRFVEFTDTGPPDLDAGSGCTHQSKGVVLCPAKDVVLTRVSLGKGDDQMRIGGGATGALIGTIRAEGNEGNDTVAGGTADDDLDGGSGDDVLDGGEGADDFRGGTGTDTADFTSRPAGSVVRVTLGDDEVDGDLEDIRDGLINKVDIKALTVSASQISLGGAPPTPPAPRTGDNVHGDVERVLGGTGGDDLVGNAVANVLVGGLGPDTLEGKAGPDRLDGGDGDDTLVSRDGEVDVLACGPGADRVVADPQDTLAADCEKADNGATPGEAPGGAVAGTPPEAAIVTRVVQVSSRGAARLRIRCVYRAQRCRGPVKLVAAVAAQVRIGRRTVRIRRGQTLATRNADIPWGTSQGLALQVGSTTARQVIARLKRGLRSRATATLVDSTPVGTAVPARLSRNVGVVRAPARARR